MQPFIVWDSSKETHPPKKPNYTPTLNKQRESIIEDVLTHKLRIKEVMAIIRQQSVIRSTTPRPKLSSKYTSEKEG